MNNIDFDRTSRGGQREQPSEERRDPPRWSWWLGGSGLVAAIIVVTSVLSPNIRHQWALSLFRQSDSYTQLAFNTAASLPATAVRGKAIPVSFIIANDEGKSVFYQYVVSSGSGTKLESLTSSSRTVTSGAIWSVTTTIIPKCAATACRVQVSLPRQSEAIDFIVQEKSPVKAKKTK